MTDTPKTTSQPAWKTRIGFITGTVWKNDDFYSVTIQRSYQNGNDWHSSSSYNHGDLLNVAKIAERCELWIVNHPVQRTTTVEE